tara:strand:+ start:256 stop:372 length:117 start_codon:yes stop_codon:yes gene_type:complete
MNNIPTKETPKSDKNGPDINKIGNKIIIQVGRVFNRND